jgi:chromatin remodeling complex protein RSC6
MATRYIYLSHELNEKLKQESNASALIVKLLEEHYNFNIGSREEIEERLKNLGEKQKTKIEIFKKEIEKLEEVKENIEDKEKATREQEERIKRNELSKRESRNNIFKDITGRDMSDDEYNEFNELFELDLVTILDYANNKASEVLSNAQS